MIKKNDTFLYQKDKKTNLQQILILNMFQKVLVLPTLIKHLKF